MAEQDRSSRTAPEVELGEGERQVLEALAALEQRVGAARVDEVAAEAGMGREAVADALTALISDDRDLVRELSGEEPDLGPRYRVKDSAS